MVFIIGLVFFGAFAVVALLLYAGGSGKVEQEKQVLASLDSALATESVQAREQILDLRKSDTFSAIPWLNDKLLNADLGPKLQNLLHQANLKWTVGGLLTMCVGGFLAPALLIRWKFGSTLFAVLIGLAIATLPVLFVLYKRKKRFDAFQEELPEALDLMVSALRAGHSLIAAMGLVARECQDPIGAEFRSCFEEQNFGLELKTALDNLIHRVPLQDLRITTTAIMIQKESGGNLAEVLDKTAHVIRERFRLKREIRTHTAQGRITGIVLTCLPVALGVALYIVDPDMISILWKREIGIKMLWAAAGMIVVGGLVIKKIVDMDV
jgi:tight adherence protein B